MSPMTMAILGLIAWKAFKHFTASQPGATAAPAPPPSGAGTGAALAARSEAVAVLQVVFPVVLATC